MGTISEKLSGCAVLRAVGAEPAAYLSRLARENIAFWNVEPADECTVVFRVALRDAEKALSFAPACYCDVGILARRSYAEAFKKLRRRRVLCVLPLILLGLLIWSSFYVWRIEIVGNEKVPASEILNALEDGGVYIGAYWPAFTSDNIRSSVLVEIPELKWLSVSVSGSLAHVVVREATEPKKPVDEKLPVKLVAALPGYIDEMEICRGFAKFQKGQAALTGETLADGAVPDALGGVRLVHAQGRVMAETYQELTAEMPQTELEKQPEGRVRRRFALLFGGKRINFYAGSRIFDENCDTIIKVHKLAVKNLFELPVAIVTETSRPFQTAARETEEASAKERLQKELESELQRRVGADGEIENAEYSFTTLNGWRIATLRAHCRQNIAKEQPMTAAEIAEAEAAAKPKEENKTE